MEKANFCNLLFQSQKITMHAPISYIIFVRMIYRQRFSKVREIAN